MEKAKVYFTDFRATNGISRTDKLKKLMYRAGIDQIDFKDKFVAIKLHFGEPGNLAFLRPNYAKAVADVVKELGGIPFLTDCNTMYPGRRKNALEHIEAAYENGFSPFSTGCHVIIGDGLKGRDETLVPVPGAEFVKQAKIGKAVMEADIIISLAHFKGHETVGFGGTLKNLGMGCGSRAGKMDQHRSGKPTVNQALCKGCGQCKKHCAQDAFVYAENGKASIDQDKCVGCGRCVMQCNFDAIAVTNRNSKYMVNCKMAEYTKAVVYGRPSFHISLVQDVTPFCDCHPENDTAILPDVGMFMSTDPIALDQACADACLRCEPLPNSVLWENMHKEGFCDHHDHFVNTTPDVEWQSGLAHGEKIGLGTRTYELITMK